MLDYGLKSKFFLGGDESIKEKTTGIKKDSF